MNFALVKSYKDFKTFTGTPPIIVFAGTPRVTTAPAATIELASHPNVFVTELDVTKQDVSMEDYRARAGAFTEWHGTMNHRQIGDSSRLKTAVTELAKLKDVPLRFVAGTSAPEGSIEKLRVTADNLEKAKKRSSSTDRHWKNTMTS